MARPGRLDVLRIGVVPGPERRWLDPDDDAARQEVIRHVRSRIMSSDVPAHDRRSQPLVVVRRDSALAPRLDCPIRMLVLGDENGAPGITAEHGDLSIAARYLKVERVTHEQVPDRSE